MRRDRSGNSQSSGPRKRQHGRMRTEVMLESVRIPAILEAFARRRGSVAVSLIRIGDVPFQIELPAQRLDGAVHMRAGPVRANPVELGKNTGKRSNRLFGCRSFVHGRISAGPGVHDPPAINLIHVPAGNMTRPPSQENSSVFELYKSDLSPAYTNCRPWKCLCRACPRCEHFVK
jgi:hypothetical protein